MQISAENVRELREKTGAGIMDCKRALTETDCDVERAITFLREKGLAAAGKKAGRATNEGLVTPYIHSGGKIGVLLEINCETDFVAKTDDFQNMCKDVAMHIAAMNPEYVRREDVPADVIEKEKAIFIAQAKESGKPEKVIDKIAEGKLDKFFKDVCLLEQSNVKSPDSSIQDLVKEAIAKLGENMQVRRFVRFDVSEGEDSTPETEDA
ncbi:MAG: translation elongation factor Ts [Deltaproteobacteria bacterium]|nr:translation elongation factor Ts [Deltaproteobacteria bacterium]